MLVPGEYLTKTAADEPVPEPAPGRGVGHAPTAGPDRDAVETEELQSFLMILLRALGVMHT
jgi:hypothetical protein